MEFPPNVASASKVPQLTDAAIIDPTPSEDDARTMWRIFLDHVTAARGTFQPWAKRGKQDDPAKKGCRLTSVLSLPIEQFTHVMWLLRFPISWSY